MTSLRTRRLSLVVGVVVVVGVLLLPQLSWHSSQPNAPAQNVESTLTRPLASEVLNQLPIKGRASKANYQRTQFGSGWASEAGCDTRNIILARDLLDIKTNQECQVTSGRLDDPYTGQAVKFIRGADTSHQVQIDHVVALSNAWQTGAQKLSYQRRIAFANDPLNLLAVDGQANQQKSDGDAATWLPSNKPFRCQYVARQVAVKSKYDLWVTTAEKDAINRVLTKCSNQRLPVE